jgi:DNA glycosylase AlkZ-like
MSQRHADPSFTAAQAAAFRLTRQHLVAGPKSKNQGPATTLAGVCRDTAGIQAQVMSAAEIGLWTRRRGTTRQEIRQALWTSRELVKTSPLRFTLHLIPSDDFAIYITAMKPTASALVHRIAVRLRAAPADVDVVNNAVVEALRDGPKTQQELIVVARSVASPRMRLWLKLAWSAVRPAVVEGLICYGPPKGGEATFVRVDQWLPPQPRIDVERARAELLRRFLSAFGPATAADFSKWTGMRAAHAKAALESLGGEAVRVRVDGETGWLLERDLDALDRSAPDEQAIRILPGFDTFLLAHATKEHLVEARHYKRVYRPQAWISPVVLSGGRIVAVWFSKAAGRSVDVDVQPFGRMSRGVKDAIATEFSALGEFLGSKCDVRFTS